MPFYEKGIFRLFYLHDARESGESAKQHTWHQISTRDFLQFSDHGLMLAGGTEKDPDWRTQSGCVIKVDDTYHIFYTGGNPYFRKAGKPGQVTCHAVSDDLLSWTKIPEDTFPAREDIYSIQDFRDPYVFWNEDAGEFWMLLCARIKEGPPRRRGCIALCTSKDLKKWEIREPFWAPRLYFVIEVPDIFRIAEWWYIVFSEFNDELTTHYRMSKSLSGPWLSPTNDTFDASSFYAAKTASDGKRRFLFGWAPTKDGENDHNNWQWGGNLIVHEILQNADGTLSIQVPDTVDQVFRKDVSTKFRPTIGEWEIRENFLSTQSPGCFSCALSEKMPRCCKIVTKMSFARDTRACGIIFRSSDDAESAYYFRLEPGKNRMVFDLWPRKSVFPDYPYSCISNSPFLDGYERFAELQAGVAYELKIFVEDNLCVAYLNDQVALSSRIYNLREGRWGVFAIEGSASFTDTKLYKQS
jgi:beta-fructofuranosidase